MRYLVANAENSSYQAIPLGDRIKDIYGKLKERDLFWKKAYASHKSMEIMDASFDEIPNRNKDFENLPIPKKIAKTWIPRWTST